MFLLVCLDVVLLRKILVQLVRSDGMKVTDDFLLKNHVYYIDNVELIEVVEKLIVRHYFDVLFNEHGVVGYDELFDCFTPTYINYDKFFNELLEEYGCVGGDVGSGVKCVDMTLNKYL